MKVETIPARQRTRKGQHQVLVSRPLNLRPGDRTEVLRQAGRVSVVIYRAGLWKRLKVRVFG